MKNKDIQIRDPFVFTNRREGKYYLFGSTDKNIWGVGTGFDVYVGDDLENWEGPFPAFRPEPGFYAERNFWAPEVYEYKGRYYMFATFRRSDNDLIGTAVLASDSLTGPFRPHSDGPVTPKDWPSLDGTLYIDDEGKPWMVFCHEWTQVMDGRICAMRLTEDLKSAASEPVDILKASEAPWTDRLDHKSTEAGDVYVTDGSFIHKGADGELLLLWASFVQNRYALGVAKSPSGRVTGPWIHEDKALYQNDGGHGMIFRTLDDGLMLTIHTPNKTPQERPVFIPVAEKDGWIRVVPEAGL